MRYAWNGDVSLAYQVVGDGPTDLLYLQGYCSQVDMNWERPYLAHFLRRLARHARLIVTDRRGWGCSERFTPGYVPDVHTGEVETIDGKVGGLAVSIGARMAGMADPSEVLAGVCGRLGVTVSTLTRHAV